MMRVINIETLEIFDSVAEVARKHNICYNAVYNSILFGYKTKGTRYEYFDDWKFWTDKQKEKHTRKNNIFFIGGEK